MLIYIRIVREKLNYTISQMNWQSICSKIGTDRWRGERERGIEQQGHRDGWLVREIRPFIYFLVCAAAEAMPWCWWNCRAERFRSSSSNHPLSLTLLFSLPSMLGCVRPFIPTHRGQEIETITEVSMWHGVALLGWVRLLGQLWGRINCNEMIWAVTPNTRSATLMTRRY